MPQYSAQKQMMTTGLGGSEPERRVPPGQHVLLDPKSRDVETVNHVLRGHRQLDCSPQRHMQLIDFGSPFGVLQVPHPLLAHDGDIERVAGRRIKLEIDVRGPDIHHCRENHGDDDPECLEPAVDDGRIGAIDLRAPGVAHREGDDQDANQPGKEKVDCYFEEKSCPRSLRWTTPVRGITGNST